MVDVVGPTARSRMMSGIRGKDTKPEMAARRALFSAGYRYRLHLRDLPGSPDVAMPARKIAVFVHGCFWHMHAGCKNSKLPSTRPDFWRAKLEGNVARDARHAEVLARLGWRVLTVWECATRSTSKAELARVLHEWIEGGECVGSISSWTPR